MLAIGQDGLNDATGSQSADHGSGIERRHSRVADEQYVAAKEVLIEKIRAGDQSSTDENRIAATSKFDFVGIHVRQHPHAVGRAQLQEYTVASLCRLGR